MNPMIARADVEGQPVPKSWQMKTKIILIHVVTTDSWDRTGKRGGSIDFVTSVIRFNGHINVARRLSRNRVRVPSSGLIVATSKLF